MIRGFPIPIIFIREQSDLTTLEPIREVVDGQQRLRTLLSFVAPEMLTDYDESRDSFVLEEKHSKEFAQKDFEVLPTNVRKGILNYDVSVHVLSSDTDDREVLQIFARMNSTGVRLNHRSLEMQNYLAALSNSHTNSPMNS